MGGEVLERTDVWHVKEGSAVDVRHVKEGGALGEPTFGTSRMGSRRADVRDVMKGKVLRKHTCGM